VIRILLVDDHPTVREGIAAVLADEPEFEVIGEAGTGEQALRETALRHPDVVILDVRLPDCDGLKVCEMVLKRQPGTRVLIFTSAGDETTMLAAFAAGARGFMVKESDPTALRLAVRYVAEGGTFVDPRVAGKLVAFAAKGLPAKGPHGLSSQEMRVLRFLPLGYSNREIGFELGISEETVKTHVRNTLRKLGVGDRAKAAAMAQREGLL
jgi:DNA-binding NarL/FixJ family response regulator